MNELSIIDRFTAVFVAYIDSGFGLLDHEVAFLTSALIAIDITLAGLFWSLAQDIDLLARLIRKVLYIGAFALLLNNWSWLADILFRSFAGLGLQASASGLTAADLLRPGFVAAAGFDAAAPLLRQAGRLIGFRSFFDNIVTVLVLLFAWAVVLLAFFLLAVQLFVTIVEFKLTSLTGFVLVPFALWNRTAFLAERVLGHVAGAGVKMMVLAVILGIGTGLFGAFVAAAQAEEPSLAQAMAEVLGALALFGLGIFGPGIAAGLTAGAPQLGAGAAVGTLGGVAAGSLAATGLGLAALRMAGGGGLAALRAATTLATGPGANSAGSPRGPSGGSSGGPSGGPPGGSSGTGQAARRPAGAGGSGPGGRAATGRKPGGGPASAGSPAGHSAPQASSSSAAMPAWAQRLQAEQRRRAALFAAAQAVRDGDRPAGGASPDLKEPQ